MSIEELAQTAEAMNDIEHDFAARMQTAPPAQQKHFRETLNLLMQAYGENAPLAIMASVIDRRNGTLMVHGINMSTEEMQIAATLTMETVYAQMTPPVDPKEVH